MDTVPHDTVDFIVDMTDCKLLDNAVAFRPHVNKPHPKWGDGHGRNWLRPRVVECDGALSGTDTRAKPSKLLQP
jgi:hypothetical protein